MIPRRQLPVYSPLRLAALLPALRAALTGGEADHDLLARQLARTFGARRVALTDSGTSALVLAFRMMSGEGGTVALPGFACVDLVAAAVRARVRVRLYDVDPATLSPDLDSVSRVLARGVDAVVVAHLYGFPADVPGVTEMATAHGVPVIEDAAQGAGGTLRGAALGSFGTVTVLSFGRGKGITGGSGGALLAFGPDADAQVAALGRGRRRRASWRDLAVAGSSWALGRPALYALPGAIPGLRLGEMVYHAAREPGTMSAAAAGLVRAAMPFADAELAVRRRNAEWLMEAIGPGEEPRVKPISRGAAGYLRFPVRSWRERTPVPRLGILRAYPRTLAEQEELRPWLEPGQVAPSGAAELSGTLFTLPVHSLMTRQDLEECGAWLRSHPARLPHQDLLIRA